MEEHDVSAIDIDAKVDALVNSPLGCAFLLIMQDSGLSPADAARPAASLNAAAHAGSEMQVWSGEHAKMLEYARLKAPGLKPLARALLEHPATDWWFGPVKRDAQVWAANYFNPPATPTRAKFAPPTARLNRRGQTESRPFGGLYTSTLMDGITSLFVDVDMRASDICTIFGDPIASWKMRAREDARVYEITGPMDWHALCLRYPARGYAGHPQETQAHRLYPLTRLDADAPVDEDSFLTLDWPAAAEDWDGVHLTLGGLLTADKVRVASAAGWTMLAFWDIEQTIWLRWAFEGAVLRMPDHYETQPELDLGFPIDYWDFRGPIQPHETWIAEYKMPEAEFNERRPELLKSMGWESPEEEG